MLEIKIKGMKAIMLATIVGTAIMIISQLHLTYITGDIQYPTIQRIASFVGGSFIMIMFVVVLLGLKKRG